MDKKTKKGFKLGKKSKSLKPQNPKSPEEVVVDNSEEMKKKKAIA